MFNIKKLLIFSAVLGVTFSIWADNRPEWRKRPFEITQGFKPRSTVIWDIAKGDLEKWSVRGVLKLSAFERVKLWNDQTVRADVQKNGSATLIPPAPLAIPDDSDGLELWFYGPRNSAPRVFITVGDANNRRYKLKLSGSGSRWDYRPWWGAGCVLLPKEAEKPLRVINIRFEGLNLNRYKNDFFCFDHLGAYKLTKPELLDIHKVDLPFPVTADGIMPIGMKAGAENKVSADNTGNVFSFEYSGSDGKLVYKYTPKSGTLSDLTCNFNGKEFAVAQQGGIVAKYNGVKFAANDPSIKAQLIKCKLENNKLFTQWRWSKNNADLEFALNFRIKGKSLEVEAKTLTDGAEGLHFDAGFFKNVRNPRLFGLSYLHNRWDQPKLLVTDDFFASTFIDWYFSHASWITETDGYGGLPRAEVYQDNSSVRVMGGSTYTAMSNDRTNPLYERFYITVSADMHDCMPNIANPPSRFLEETGRMLCATRMHSVQEERWQQDLPLELDFWATLKAYGAGDWFVRFHEEQFRTPIENNRFCRSLDGARQIGGDETLKTLVKGMSQRVRRYGTYNNPRIIHPYAPEFKYSEVAFFKDKGYLEGWDGCFRPKCTVTARLQADFVPKFKAKYGWNAEYLDELTNAPPWGDVDFDASTPGAGMFTTVFKCYGHAALQQKAMYDGPIWSEGCAAYFWAGLLDVDYATSNEKKSDMPLVDFKVMKLKKLSNYTGAAWDILYSRDTDLQIATQIAYGSIGHIPGRIGKTEPTPMHGQIYKLKPDHWQELLRSYFMMRQLQELYCGESAVDIRYNINGKLMTTNEMLKGNHPNSGLIYVKYANGLEVWVNRSAKENWSVKVNGQNLTLPPNGHAAFMAGKLLQYTALVNGHKADYSSGFLYTYFSGRGELTNFGRYAAKYSYLLQKNSDGKNQLIPAPFTAAETVSGLEGKTARKLDKTAHDLKQSVSILAGKLEVDGSCFSYMID
ncbi:MAG: hypothetical protein E7056_08470 [Lentisphaerae bacterium]|nr:hypothetical protein [Lentisphaerota bacterium]